MKLGRFLMLTLAATIIAGTLDLAGAIVIARSSDSGAVRLLQHVAAGIFGERAGGNLNFALVGLGLHYAIMACMAGVYMAAAPRLPWARSHPLLTGGLYGALLWAVMSQLVVPLRFAGQPHFFEPLAEAARFLCHVLLVGMPIALIYAQAARPAKPPLNRRRSDATPARAPRR